MKQTNKRCKLLIYDCDGVMLDTLESNYIFYNRVMEHLGRPPLDRSDLKARTVLHTYSFENVMEYFSATTPAAIAPGRLQRRSITGTWHRS